MQKTIKLLCLLLVGIMMIGMLAACGGDENTPEDTTDASDDTQPAGDSNLDENGYLKDSLPESYDFGKEFKILTWNGQKAWEWVDEIAEQPTSVEQVLWEREANVEERFGVEIERVYANGAWDDRNSFISTLSQNVLGNDHEYDLVGQYTPAAGIGAIMGLYTDLKKVSYIDLEKPWWPSSITETATVGDKLYFVTGDITPTLIRNVQCMFVNTSLYESYQLAKEVDGRSIYDVVKDYDWTMENMLKMALNKVSVEQGNYGLVMLNQVSGDSFFYGAGFTYVKNEGGIMTLSDDLSNNLLINYFDQVKELFTGRYEDVAIVSLDPFLQNKALFYNGNVSDSQQLSAEGVQFSLLPMPLLNEDQQEYRTCSNFWVTVYSVPVDASDMNMSGVILEALASEAYRTVSDEIYYNMFQIRYNGADEDSAKMFDIVSDSVVFDTARFFPDALGLFAQFRLGVNDVSGNWSTIYGGAKDSWTEKIQKLYADVG